MSVLPILTLSRIGAMTSATKGLLMIDHWQVAFYMALTFLGGLFIGLRIGDLVGYRAGVRAMADRVKSDAVRSLNGGG